MNIYLQKKGYTCRVAAANCTIYITPEMMDGQSSFPGSMGLLSGVVLKGKEGRKFSVNTIIQEWQTLKWFGLNA